MTTAKSRSALLLSILLCAGCVSMGTNYDQNAVTQLRPGMTIDQVTAMLGRPNSIATRPDGGQQLLWVHSTGTMFGANARSISLLFGPDGRLIQTVGQAATSTN